MAPNGIVRRIDDLGRITIPKEIRRNMGLNDGDALEITYNNGTVSIRKYKKSFEQCAIDWFNSHQYEMDNTYFRIEGEYTFCIVRDFNTPLARVMPSVSRMMHGIIALVALPPMLAPWVAISTR